RRPARQAMGRCRHKLAEHAQTTAERGRPMKTLAASGLLVLTLLAAGCGNKTEGEASSESLELNMNTTNPPTEVAPYTGFEIFQETVAELSEGEIAVRNAGGPEAIDPLEMGNVIGTGAIDAAFAAAPYMLSRIPEAAVFTYRPLTAQEMRASGAWEVIADVLEEKMNVHLLGFTLSSLDYNFYTTEPIESLDDFEGMRMRSTPGYQPLLESLGVEGIQMPSGDIFSAMERGLIEGYPQLAVGSVYPFGTEKFIKYKIGPGWWHGDVLLLIDQDYWE